MKNRIFVSALFIATTFIAMDSNAQKVTPQVRKTIEAFYQSFNQPDLLDTVLDKNFVDHMPFNPTSPQGIEGFRQTANVYRSIFSDFNFNIQAVYVDGDKVIVRHVATARHTGEFLGIKATNKTVTWHSVDIYTVRNNKLLEGWHVESFLKTYLELLHNN